MRNGRVDLYRRTAFALMGAGLEEPSLEDKSSIRIRGITKLKIGQLEPVPSTSDIISYLFAID